MFDHVSTVTSYKSTVEFINRVINTPNESLTSSFSRINSKGEFSPLNDHYKEVLEWEKVGIVPDVNHSEIKAKATSRRS